MNPYYNPTIPSVNPTPSGNIRTSISNPVANPYAAMTGGGMSGGGGLPGGLASAAGIAASLVSDWGAIGHQGLGLNGMEQPGTSSYSGDFINRPLNTRVQKLTGAELVPDIIKGGAVGAIGTIFASKIRRRRQESEKNDAIASALGYQSQYNAAQTASDQQATSTADYQRRIDKYTQNLYSWNAT